MTTTVTMHVGDVRDVMSRLPDRCADLLVTSPPFLALRSYLPPGHPDKHREIGSEPTPAAFLDTLYGLTADWGRLLPEWGSVCVELGDTMSGSGGGGGDYLPGGLRDGQPGFGGSAERARDGNAAHWRQKVADRDAWPLAKSMCLIPHAYTIGLAYGHNPLTGTPSPAGQWRVRNVVCWARPNPPVGSLGKRNPHARTGDQKFRPATSYITIACRGTGRYFDLDAVRGGEDALASVTPRNSNGSRGMAHPGEEGGKVQYPTRIPSAPGGAPPLDWHADDLDGDWLWRLPTAPYKGSHYACVDDQTEALTPHGWRRHDQLRDGDLIAAWSADTETWRFEPATFHRYDYDGDLVAIDKRVTNQRLTPNHRVVYMTAKDPAWRIRRADSLTSHCRLPVAATMDDGGIGPGEKAAALAGWYCTEGGIVNRYPAIHQSLTANPDKVDAIRSLLDGLGADYRERHRSRPYFGRENVEVVFQVRGALAEWLRQFHKHLPMSTVFGWSTVDARALFEAMVDGDGHRRPDGRMSFIQKAKPVAEAFQMLAVRLGYRTTLSQRPDGQWLVYVSPGRTIDLRAGVDGMASAVTTEHYAGQVWCPSVSTGMWLARRRGQPFITGNTFPLTLPRRLVLAMCPERVCRECGWPSERIVTAEYEPHGERRDEAKGTRGHGVQNGEHAQHMAHGRATLHSTTLGWTDCECPAFAPCDICRGPAGPPVAQPYCDGCTPKWRPGIVLDPFGGSGTTAVAAALEGRDAVLIDLDVRNVDLVRRRLHEAVRILNEQRDGDTITWTVEAVSDHQLANHHAGQMEMTL